MKKEFKSLSEKMLIGKSREYLIGKILFEKKDIKEFIKIIENIIVERKSARVQLIELKNAAGDKLIC